MSYTEVWTVVDGALDEEHTVDKDDVMEDGLPYDVWLDRLDAQADEEGFTVEVYEIDHGHEEDEIGEEGCNCAQYLTSHKPSYVFGPEAEE